jgi:hypothetical protein
MTPPSVERYRAPPDAPTPHPSVRSLNATEPRNGVAATNDQWAPPSRVRKRRPRFPEPPRRIQPSSALANVGVVGFASAGRNDDGCPLGPGTSGVVRQLLPASPV